MTVKDVSRKADELADRIERDGLTDRSFSEAINLMQNMADELEELEESFNAVSDQVVIEVDGKRIRFESVDQFADFAAKVMHNDRR